MDRDMSKKNKDSRPSYKVSCLSSSILKICKNNEIHEKSEDPKTGYKVSYLSSNNKLKICRNKEMTLKDRMIKYFKQLCTYKIDFIRYYNDSSPFVIYLVNKFVLKLAKRILSKSDVFEQCIRYDNYQETNGFYLTILSIIDIELIDKPVLPLFYLVHEQNNESVHFDFWSKFVLMHLKNYTLPLAVSNKTFIRDAVLESIESRENNLFFCSNHIYDQVSTFYSTHLSDTVDFKHIGIENLVDASIEEEFEEFYNDFKCLWPKNYLEFFDNEIKPLIKSNIKRAKSKSNLRLSPLRSAAFAIELSNYDEFSLTDLILRLNKHSFDLLIKFNDDYQIKDKIKPEFRNQRLSINSNYIDYMDVRTHDHRDLSCINLFNPSIFKLFHFQLADLAFKNDLVIYDSLNCRILVKSPFNETVNTVTQIDEEGNTKCTCQMISTQLCFHRIAAKFYFLNNIV